MRSNLYLSLLIGILLCLVGWTAHAQLQSSGPARRAWEYKQFRYTKEALDEAGAQGWELVAVTASPSADWCYVKRAR